MKKLIETIKNIWAIEELRNKILFTLGLLLVYRVGVQIVLPGINPNNIKLGSGEGILGLLNSFAGGAFNNASIFALGIMPYISASIAMQLLQIAYPPFKKLGSDESGRKRLNSYTRYLTILVTLVQAVAYIGYLRGQVKDAIIEDNIWWQISTVVCLITGTLFVMWLGEKITEKGIGNGTSLIIMAGIIARLPESLGQEFVAKSTRGGGGLLIFFIELLVLLATIVGIILLTQGTRRIPVNYARRMVGASSLSDISGNRDFIPLKVNMANVMPIIFAQAILFIPTAFLTNSNSAIANAFRDYTSWQYNLLYVVLVIGFTFFYTALIMNPTQMSDDLKRNNAFIPGVEPGEPTSNYIATIIDRITLPGAVLLALIGILPSIARLFGVTTGLAGFYGGTSMLIMVGVILDLLQQIETKLLEKHYDGLMKDGRIQGRTAMNSPAAVAS
ncbi:MAG: preprotein translocase subunit SecY [Bacteroidota bacterium]